MKNPKTKRYSITLKEDTMKIINELADEYRCKPDDLIQDVLDGHFGEVDEKGHDVLFDEVVDIIQEQNEVSASFIQRRFAVPFNRARRILHQLEQAGFITKAEGNKPQKIIKGN